MSDTSLGTDPTDAPTPDLEDAAETAPAPDEAADAATDAVETSASDETRAVTEAVASPATEDELGFAVPTWYVVFCALPFAAAFLVPSSVIYQAQNSVPPMTAPAAAWLGVATGWALWLIGTAGWLLGPVVLAGARRRAPDAWAWWHRTTRAWVLMVLGWGVIASLSVVAVALLLGRLSA
jgi:hypothetical protein